MGKATKRGGIKDKTFLFHLIMMRELEEVMALRFRIKELNRLQNVKKSDEKEFLTSVKGVLRILKEAKAIYEERQKMLGLRNEVSRTFGFFSTCQMMLKTSDESVREALQNSVKGAEEALKTKLAEYLKIFPKKEIIQVKDLIMDVKFPTEHGAVGKVDKRIEEDDILPRIESMMKKLVDDHPSQMESCEAAAKESAKALATLSGAFACISSFAAPKNSLDIPEKDPKCCIPDVDTILNNAINALKHEQHVKETLTAAQSRGKGNGKSHFAEQNAELQSILYQIDVDLGDLLKLYSINLDLKKKLDNPEFDLDVTNLDEKVANAPEADASAAEGDANAAIADFDDGLSDVDENVTMCCDDRYPGPLNHGA